MKQLLTLLIILVSTTSLFSQSQVSFYGYIKDKDFNALPYTNIGIKHNSENNTVSDISGYFKIECQSNDTIVIRHTGFLKVEQSVGVIINNEGFNLQRNIVLIEKVQQVEEVSVSAKKKKIRNRNYGNSSKDNAFSLEVESDKLGYEFGVKINIPGTKNVHLERFSCHVINSSVDSLKFRLNIYDFNDKDSSVNLLHNEVIVKSKMKSGNIIIELKKERIKVKGDILVTLEVVEFFGNGKVTFSTGTLSGGTYYRQGKESEWVKFPLIGLAFNVDAKVSKK